MRESDMNLLYSKYLINLCDIQSNCVFNKLSFLCHTNREKYFISDRLSACAYSQNVTTLYVKNPMCLPMSTDQDYILYFMLYCLFSFGSLHKKQNNKKNLKLFPLIWLRAFDKTVGL